MVCDAGGSTIDITTYDVKRLDKSMSLAQLAASCEYHLVWLSTLDVR